MTLIAEKITPIARGSESGRITAGIVRFSDGKEWKFSCNRWDDIFFTIDSGIPSQLGIADHVRNIAPPRRVAALRAKLEEMGEAPVSK